MVLSIVECLLCKASLNLNKGNLDKFKHHLDTAHNAIFDMDLIISVSFLQTEEKERIVDTVFPRIKKFFRDIKDSDQNTPKLFIEKRLLEEDEAEGIASFYRDHKRKRIGDSKYESLNEAGADLGKASHSSGPDASIGDSSAATRGESESPKSLKINAKYPDKGHLVPDDNQDMEDEMPHDEVDVVDSMESKASAAERFQNTNESKCDICDKVMLKKSIRKHKQRVHQIYDSFRSYSSMGLGGEGDTGLAGDEDSHDISIDQAVLEPLVDIEEKPHNEEKSSVVSCEICQKQISKRNMKRHMDTVHFKTGPSNENIEEDKDNNDDVTPAMENQRCKICLANFEDLDELKEHFKDVHEIDYDHFENNEKDEEEEDDSDEINIPEYACDQCDAKYTIKDSLRNHKRRKHWYNMQHIELKHSQYNSH